MTIEEKRQAMRKFCADSATCSQCKLRKFADKKNIYCGRGRNWSNLPEEEVELAYNYIFLCVEKVLPNITEPIKHFVSIIKDSGNRREFTTGAVRDIQEGKGRCDLLPLQEIGILYEDTPEVLNILFFIGEYQRTNNLLYLVKAIQEFIKFHYGEISTCFLELSQHFEAGAKKYGENNWQKGIPTHCYIDSAVRHFLKFLRDDSDEPHDRAFVWNLLCCIWTCKNKPELNDYSKKTESESTNDK